ncbi:hypothetical protein M885DRAFT_492254 [Pelagophyceae sp. CCMP2097]|nr:hypothetical protein M885DRAFT_492254 [Pelagophyceae sp. CCMP2097]
MDATLARFVEDGALDAATAADAVATLGEAGVAVVRGAVDARALAAVSRVCAIKVAAVRRALAARADAPHERAPETFAFRDVCGRGKGRYDVKLPEAQDLVDTLLAPSGGGASCMDVVRAALGGDPKLLALGVVVSAPGTAVQRWHADGAALFPETGFCSLPVHALTVFLPLVDVGPRQGPTQFIPGTHRGTAVVLCDGDAVTHAPAAEPLLRTGDAVIFDYRLVHRGGANSSDEDRPMLYCAFGRSWFVDDFNFPSDVPLLGDAPPPANDEPTGQAAADAAAHGAGKPPGEAAGDDATKRSNQ